ncbi:hypothetical protein AX16_004161 [Volvariella volvacea WC 439]|nr:hypothetical protein AX16_004161 [Volvariella volvacea WC 439]
MPQPTNTHQHPTIQLRCVRKSDTLAVQRLFEHAITSGPGAPLPNALRQQLSERKTYLTFFLVLLGTHLALFPPAGPYKLLYRVGGEVTALGAVALLVHYRHLISSAFYEFTGKSAEDDLRDVVEHYKLREGMDEKGRVESVAVGPTGFWIVEAIDSEEEPEGEGAEEKVALETSVDSELGLEGGRTSRIVGCVGLDIDEGTTRGHLRRMAVSSTMRGRGIGHMLIKAALDHARKHGLTSVHLSMSVYQPPAQYLYEKHGWYLVGRSFMGEGLYRMPLLHLNRDMEVGEGGEGKN